MFTNEQKEALQAKLHPQYVAQRKQGGSQVQYIEGWHAIAEANRIFGFGQWDRALVNLECIGQRETKNQRGDMQWRVDYRATVRITVYGEDRAAVVVRDGSGFGQGIDKDVGQAHESALKEAETDAMKRALMTFGNPFGLALYDKSRKDVGVDAPPPKAWPLVLADETVNLPNPKVWREELVKQAITDANEPPRSDLPQFWEANRPTFIDLQAAATKAGKGADWQQAYKHIESELYRWHDAAGSQKDAAE